MLTLIKSLVVIFTATTLSACFSNSPKKPVIIIDKSTGQENIDPTPHSKNIKPEKTIDRKTTKKILKKAMVEKNRSIPITGKIIKTFSKKHQGLTFSTQPGQIVRAIRDGVVVYSNNKMQSHGKIIIIKHPLGFYSSYTHNQSLKVQSGNKVTKGQIIAYTGKNNFYFTMKKFETPIDPLKYLE